MTKVTLSVIIPTFNEEDFIVECLDALTAQKKKIDEIILVDNNSNDKTVEIAKSYKNVSVYHENKQGQLYARIKGFDLAKGELLATVDADSVVTPDWSRQIIEYHKSGNLAFSGYVYTKEGSLNRAVALLGNFFVFTFNRAISGSYPLLGSNLMIEGKLWEKVKPKLTHRTDYWEDFEIGLIANKLGVKTSVMRESLVQISIRAATIKPRQIYSRFMGGPKTYWNYNKVAAVILFVFVHVEFLFVMLMKVTANLSYHAKAKYQGWS